MTTLREVLARPDPSFSFEFFPAKTEAGMHGMWRAIRQVERLAPDFVSVTYGAGGSSRERTIEVTKREKMELPDGSKVNCLVLHPVIDTKGLFSKRSDTRIWLTDDARRLPVQIRSKFPFGTITLRLKDMVVPGSAASTSGS